MNQKRKGFAPIIGILILALLIAGCAGYYLFKNRSFTPSASSINGNCAKEGERPDPAGKCCPGLSEISSKLMTDFRTGKSSGCMDTTGVPGVCRPCGNGKCDSGEDTCSCPADCKK
jgi:hypothetical protein